MNFFVHSARKSVLLNIHFFSYFTLSAISFFDYLFNWIHVLIIFYKCSNKNDIKKFFTLFILILNYINKSIKMILFKNLLYICYIKTI